MQTPEAPREEHAYPHQGHLEPVSPGELADDLVKHPGAYHEDLVTRHILPHLAKNGIDLHDIDVQEEDHEEQRLEIRQKLRDWREGDTPFGNEEAYELIDSGEHGVVAGNLDKFTALSFYIADTLLEDGYGLLVAKHLDAFADLNDTTAYKLIEYGYIKWVMPQIDRFAGCTPAGMLDALIEKDPYQVLSNLHLFEDISQSGIAHRFIVHEKTWALVNGISYFRDLDPEIAYSLILGDGETALLGYLNVFRDIDYDKLARMLISNNKIHSLEMYISHFRDLSDYVAFKMINAGLSVAVLRHQACFTEVDQEAAVRVLIKRGLPYAVLYNLDFITTVDYTTIALSLAEHGETNALSWMIVNCKSLNHSTLANALLANERGAPYLVNNISLFEGIDRKQIGERLIASGFARYVARILKEFPGIDHVSLADTLIREHYGHLVLANLEDFQGIDSLGILARLLREDITAILDIKPQTLARLRRDAAFVNLVSRETAQLFGHKLGEDILERAYPTIAETVGRGKVEVIDINDDIFGAAATVETARMLQEILNGSEAPPSLLKLGIGSTGPEAVAQLRALLKSIREEINSCQISEATERRIASSEILSQFFAGYTGYSTADWGHRDAGSLKRKMHYHHEAVGDGRIESMRPGYEPSRVYEILTVGTKDSDEEGPIFTEDAISKYGALRTNIISALEVFDIPLGFGGAIRSLRSSIDAIVVNLQQQLESVDDSDEKAEFKRINLSGRIDSLSQYLATAQNGRRFVMNSPADFEKGIVTLAKYPELHPALRTLTFAWAMRKNPNVVSRLRDLSDDATIDSVSTVREFVEHIVNQETFGEYFPDKRSAETFKKITSTRALEEAMRQYNQQAKSGGNLTQLQFVPTRGILMEMSGQIADACWADRYVSIAESKPNFTAVIMRARPGKKTERIMGAAMLIETVDPTTGEGVLLLRGTNPRENYINKLDAGGFYDAITDYVRQTAERRGLRPAIVIDDHSGGSSTNRPVLFGYMTAKRRELAPQPVEHATTYFNGYDVTRDSYAL